MKGIDICGDCAFYSLKKHKCTRGCTELGARDPFYKDCPLPEAVPVARGRWIYSEDEYGYYWECSVCHDQFTIVEGDMTYKYCPTCGASMSLEHEEEASNDEA